MKQFVKMALKYYYTVFVMALFILILGLLAIFKTPTDIFPEIKSPVVTAVWTYSGMPAKDIERRIITIAERSYTANVNDIEHVESQSLFGVGIVRVFLQPDADINTGITQISASSQVAMKAMPLGMKPPEVIRYTPTTMPVLDVIISSKTLPLQQVTDLAQNNIKVQLTKVEGAQVPLPMGGKVRQIMVDLDMQKMEARSLTPMDVVKAVQSQNVILPSGNAKIGSYDYYVTLNNATQTVDEMNMFPIKSKNGETVYLRDIAYIHDGNAVQTNVVRHDGVAGSLMAIYKAGKKSTIQVVNQTKKVLPLIKKTVPDSLEMQELFDQSIFVKSSIKDVVTSGTLAAILTALMILLFLGSVYSTIIVAVSIPLAILFAIIGLSLCGETLNMMTLSGLSLAIGMLVDNSTVVLENILRNKEIFKNKISIKEIIYRSAGEVAAPTLISTLSICMVFAPIFLMAGSTKYMFAPLAMSVIFAMVGSYLLSNTLVPVMVDKLLTKKEKLSETSWIFKANRFINKNFAKLRRTYKQFLVKDVIRQPKK
jgi:multidrug efflux pump subunit AcrB